MWDWRAVRTDFPSMFPCLTSASWKEPYCEGLHVTALGARNAQTPYKDVPVHINPLPSSFFPSFPLSLPPSLPHPVLGWGLQKYSLSDRCVPLHDPCRTQFGVIRGGDQTKKWGERDRQRSKSKRTDRPIASRNVRGSSDIGQCLPLSLRRHSSCIPYIQKTHNIYIYKTHTTGNVLMYV